MEEYKPSFHQRDATDFTAEIRTRIPIYEFNEPELEAIHARLTTMEQLVKKANRLEQERNQEYFVILHKLVIEKTKFFLFFDDLVSKKSKQK
jgi:hypothetical protein